MKSHGWTRNYSWHKYRGYSLYWAAMLYFSVRAIVALNLHNYASGRNPWGNLKPEYLEKVCWVNCLSFLWLLYWKSTIAWTSSQILKSMLFFLTGISSRELLSFLCKQRGFVEAQSDDGLLEIFGLKQGWHASLVMVELISAKHIAQVLLLPAQDLNSRRYFNALLFNLKLKG